MPVTQAIIDPAEIGDRSFIEWWATRSEEAQSAIVEAVGQEFFSPHNWEAYARPSQLAPPGDWRIWLFQAGRGAGKTRAAAEWVRWKVESGQAGRIAMVARTAKDYRDIMVEGVSGILNISHPKFRPKFEPSKRRLTWPNGAMATMYSAEEPDSLRGPEHDLAWADELASWKLIKTQSNDGDAWDMLRLGLRLGSNPQTIVTTTPKPVSTLRRLHKDREKLGVYITYGSTYDNRANLSPAALEEFDARYSGTRLGRQELEGQLLEDFEGALWTRAMIDAARKKVKAPDFERVIVSIDPAVSNTDKSDETGISVDAKGTDGRFYVLADKSLRASPNGWAQAAIDAFKQYGADRIIAEANNGGDMVESTLRNIDPAIPFKKVWASRGKVRRAEPISALYEQGRVSHLDLDMTLLEDQLCALISNGGYAMDGSPDRADALVWGLTELSGAPAPPNVFWV